MDSITQIVLGAAVGEVLLGRKLGNKAMLLGAIGGTIPDLDVVYRLFSDDPIHLLKVHRSYSHSMFTHLLLALPFAWFSVRKNKAGIPFGRWYLFWFLCFFTHALLDCCTNYGTQFLLPFTNYQVGFNNISVIDPVYTIPFMVLLGVCLFLSRESIWRRKFLWASIIVSSMYMVFTFGVKYTVQQKFRSSLEQNHMVVDELNTTPTMFNSILWSAVAFNDSVLYTAEYSFWNSEIPIRWTAYPRNLDKLPEYDSKSLRTIEWFSDGNYFAVPLENDSIAFFNVKFGRMQFNSDKPEDAFFFYWKFYRENGEVHYKEVRRSNFNFKEALRMLAHRIGI